MEAKYKLTFERAKSTVQTHLTMKYSDLQLEQAFPYKENDGLNLLL